MDTKHQRIIGGALVIGLVSGGAGLAVAAAGGGDQDEPLTGTDLASATQVALERTGGGTVIDSEVGDDGAAYSVEVRLEDGRVMEVNLDERFRVIGAVRDEDGPREATDQGDS